MSDSFVLFVNFAHCCFLPNAFFAEYIKVRSESDNCEKCLSF